MNTTESALRERLEMTTASGRHLLVAAPSKGDIWLHDIADGLAKQCRYNGQILTNFYSVAEHSVLCALEARRRGLSTEIVKACLMHDAAEAYCGDMIWPVKELLRRMGETAYDQIEARFAWAIGERFGLPEGYAELPEVKEIDQVLCALEQVSIRRMPKGWAPHVPVSSMVSVHGWSPREARIAFLSAAELLLEQR